MLLLGYSQVYRLTEQNREIVLQREAERKHLLAQEQSLVQKENDLAQAREQQAADLEKVKHELMLQRLLAEVWYHLLSSIGCSYKLFLAV